MNNCLVVEDSRLARVELVQLLKDIGSFEEILEAKDAVEAKELLEEQNPDVIFLDIHLPGMNGFEFLESLDYSPKVIFTTAYDEYALKSFDYNAIDYLLKPIRQEKLEAAIEKLALNKVKKTKTISLEQQIFVRDGEQCWFVKLGDIRVFESVGNYCKVYFDQHKPMIQKSLSYLEGTLDEQHFIRVNRQQIVNLTYIDKMVVWFNGKLKVTLKTGEEIEVSRRQSQRIKALFSL